MSYSPVATSSSLGAPVTAGTIVGEQLELVVAIIEQLEERAIIDELGDRLFSILDETAIAGIGVDVAVKALGGRRAFVALEEPGSDQLRVAAHEGMPADFDGFTMAYGEGISGQAAAAGQIINLYPEDDATTDTGGVHEAVLAIPLRRFRTSGARRVFGVLTIVGAAEGGRFDGRAENLAGIVASHLAMALHNCRLVSSVRVAEQTRQELQLAATVQQTLLPSDLPAIEGWSVAGRCEPAALVGGDWYSHLVSDDEAWLLIADVAGHSVGSALMMGHASAALRLAVTAGGEPGGMLEHVNRAISPDLASAGLFITVQAAKLDPSDGSVVLASGGHNPAAVVRRDGSVEFLDPDGFPIGFLDEAEYDQARLRLETGDLLVLYTDGVVESRRLDGELFGDERFAELLAQSRNCSASELVDQIYSQLASFSFGTDPTDDITVVVARREATR